MSHRKRVLVILMSLAMLALALVACSDGAGVRKTLTSNDEVQRIAPQDAAEAVRQGTAVIYDVRVRGAYDAEHIAGAEALPENELEDLYALLPADKDLILYCT